MSYSIEYDPEKNKLYPQKSERKHKWLIIALVAMISLFFLQKIDSKHVLKSFLIPGDPEITSAAFSSMVEDIREGDTVANAVTAFCLEIIDNG